MKFPAVVKRKDMSLLVSELWLAGYVCERLGGTPIFCKSAVWWGTIWVREGNRTIGMYTLRIHEDEYEWVSTSPEGEL